MRSLRARAIVVVVELGAEALRVPPGDVQDALVDEVDEGGFFGAAGLEGVGAGVREG